MSSLFDSVLGGTDGEAYRAFESLEGYASVDTPGWQYFSKKPLLIRELPCEFDRAEIVASIAESARSDLLIGFGMSKRVQTRPRIWTAEPLGPRFRGFH